MAVDGNAVSAAQLAGTQFERPPWRSAAPPRQEVRENSCLVFLARGVDHGAVSGEVSSRNAEWRRSEATPLGVQQVAVTPAPGGTGLAVRIGEQNVVVGQLLQPIERDARGAVLADLVGVVLGDGRVQAIADTRQEVARTETAASVELGARIFSFTAVDADIVRNPARDHRVDGLSVTLRCQQRTYGQDERARDLEREFSSWLSPS